MVVAKGDVAVAFAMSAAAGLATTLGACIVFFARLANRRMLAISLGAAGGVMLFVSFYDLLTQTAISSFVKAGIKPNYARLYALISFFSGILLLRALDWLLHRLSDLAEPNSEVPSLNAAESHGGGLPDWLLAQDEVADITAISHEFGEKKNDAGIRAPPDRHHHQPIDLERAASPAGDRELSSSLGGGGGSGGGNLKGGISNAVLSPKSVGFKLSSSEADDNKEGHDLADATKAMESAKSAKLLRTGLLTAVVLGIHNFPEGVATFVSALQDMKLGVSMCFAIAIHNIPEGVCVSMPVYYATGNKWKALRWAFLSGIAEPVGGLLAYAVLAERMDDCVFGVLFGGIAGVMVSIVLAELLPAARKYDPQDKVVTNSLVFGMAVMAASLVLFDFQF